MDQIKDMFRGFNFLGDNPTLVFLILGLVILLMISNGDLGCFFEQNNSLMWIVAIVFIVFLFNNNNDDCYC
ncbi:MAG TPA: hypothetical protein K8V90_07355 [Romboutsia timonensis]|uniref:Uncharacterized protein n=1 Tax=Romboutsia timonensis TaxID=1776391 RepID=A0A921N2H0_9FIRM|nr:hypothetical protein [uncultured Romboutsia sp.]HJG96899.1 hypothetical protein [Romboutsia timonensis]